MTAMHEHGAVIGLPVVIEKERPLVFREWKPRCPMERGVWNIPIPSEGREIVPDVVISPVVGIDPECYRLGYGGGFYDRTLANLSNDPLVLGVGYPMFAIDTIFPLPHDIPMDRVLLGQTERVRPGTD
jgi:5,10-methenyltetrahydrofolate synthetase